MIWNLGKRIVFIFLINYSKIAEVDQGAEISLIRRKKSMLYFSEPDFGVADDESSGEIVSIGGETRNDSEKYLTGYR